MQGVGQSNLQSFSRGTFASKAQESIETVKKLIPLHDILFPLSTSSIDLDYNQYKPQRSTFLQTVQLFARRGFSAGAGAV